MKQKDIAIIIVIAFFSAVISFLASNRLFVTPAGRNQQAEVVDAINATFQTPDKKYFNSNSIDPTQQAVLGTGTNSDPFNGAGR